MKRPIGENRNLSLKMLEPYYQDFLTMVRQEMPYRTPKGYLRWEVLSQIIASAIYFSKDRVPTNSPVVAGLHPQGRNPPIASRSLANWA